MLEHMEAFTLTCVEKVMSKVAKLRSNRPRRSAIKSGTALIDHHPVPTEPPEVLLHRADQTVLPLDLQSEDLFSRGEVV